jgi:hypothetical protein
MEFEDALRGLAEAYRQTDLEELEATKEHLGSVTRLAMEGSSEAERMLADAG